MGVAREGLKGHRKGNSYGGVITIYVGGVGAASRDGVRITSLR